MTLTVLLVLALALTCAVATDLARWLRHGRRNRKHERGES